MNCGQSALETCQRRALLSISTDAVLGIVDHCSFDSSWPMPLRREASSCFVLSYYKENRAAYSGNVCQEWLDQELNTIS